MKDQQAYLDDLAAIRSMMERSSRFLSLSGWSGVMAGIYSLLGVGFAHFRMGFAHKSLTGNGTSPADFTPVFLLGLGVLAAAVATAVVLSVRHARKRGEKLRHPASRHLVVGMALPLAASGLLMLVCYSQGLLGLLIPLSLIFYGLALADAGRWTYHSLRHLRWMQVALGLLAAWQIPYSLWLLALGFGLLHIGYGLYICSKYQR